MKIMILRKALSLKDGKLIVIGLDTTREDIINGRQSTPPVAYLRRAMGVFLHWHFYW